MNPLREAKNLIQRYGYTMALEIATKQLLEANGQKKEPAWWHAEIVACYIQGCNDTLVTIMQTVAQVCKPKET